MLKERDKRLEDGKKELQNLKHLIRVLEKTVLDYQNRDTRDSKVRFLRKTWKNFEKLQEKIEKMLHLQQKLAVLRENFRERVKNDQKKASFLEKLEKKLLEVDPQGSFSDKTRVKAQFPNDYSEVFWKMRAKVLLLKKTIQRENKTFFFRNKQNLKNIDQFSQENRDFESKIREKERVFCINLLSFLKKALGTGSFRGI